MAKATFSGLDFAGKRTRFAVHGLDLTAGNIAAQLGLVDALLAALANFSYIPFGNTVNARDVTSVGQATDADGLRSMKARVRYSDDVTGEVYDVEVPAPIRTGNLIAGSDFFDLADAQVAAFVSAFENYVRDPEAALNAVTVLNIQSVGRSL